jgi:hypothetical protein
VGDPLDEILRLVADGRLSPEEAAPLVDALASARAATARARAATEQARAAGQAARESARAARAGWSAASSGAPGSSGPPRRIRVQVREAGRTVVDLQLPGVLAELAAAVPGIPTASADQVREAIRTGLRGPIVDVTDEDGSGVTITID